MLRGRGTNVLLGRLVIGGLMAIVLRFVVVGRFMSWACLLVLTVVVVVVVLLLLLLLTLTLSSLAPRPSFLRRVPLPVPLSVSVAMEFWSYLT